MRSCNGTISDKNNNKKLRHFRKRHELLLHHFHKPLSDFRRNAFQIYTQLPEWKFKDDMDYFVSCSTSLLLL